MNKKSKKYIKPKIKIEKMNLHLFFTHSSSEFNNPESILLADFWNSGCHGSSLGMEPC